jgi:glycosyltransferase 2 family protein
MSAAPPSPTDAEDAPAPTGRQRLFGVLKRVFQLGLTGLLFWLATRKVDWQQVRLVWAEAQWLWVVVAFVALNTGQLFSARRQQRMLRFARIGIPYRLSAWLFYQGMFYNLVLPGGISGDGYKGYYLNRQVKGRLKEVITALVLERGSGALALLGLCSLLVTLTSVTGAPDPTVALWVRLGTYAAWAVVLLLPVAILAPIEDAGPWHWVRAIQAVMPISLITQVCQLGFCLCMVLALNIPLAQATPYLLAFAASSLVAVLPVSFGGIGAREYVMSHAYLLLAAVTIENGFVIALSYNVLYLLSAGLGALIPKPKGAATDLKLAAPQVSVDEG